MQQTTDMVAGTYPEDYENNTWDLILSDGRNIKWRGEYDPLIAYIHGDAVSLFNHRYVEIDLMPAVTDI